MRTRLTAALLTLGLVAVMPVLASPAGADELAVVCTPTDPRITEASGLVLLEDGFAVVNDGGESIEVFVLDSDCDVQEVRTASVDPYDVEDLALGPDGTLWLADIGDNRANRSTVAVEVLTADGAASVHRLTYPGGPRDAEAMLVADDGHVVIVAKTLNGKSGVYRSPSIDPDAGGGSPQRLTKVGEVEMQETGTPGGPVGPPLNNLMITGAAQCPDRVALRTYTDLYLWPLGDDLAETIVGTSPQVVALPVQQQGESVALSADCGTAYIHGEGVGTPIQAVSLPAAQPASPVASPGSLGGAADEESSGDRRALWSLGAIAVLAAVALGLGLRSSRR